MSVARPAQRERPSGLKRRKQILEAAQHCFVQHGFHATSMSCIAGAADIPVSLIYRYFAGKETIIAAIVAQDVQEAVRVAEAIEADQAEMIPAVIDQFRRKIIQRSDPEECALLLEVWAEAARNPKIAKLVREARTHISQRLSTLISIAAPGRWTADDIRKKVDMLLMLLDCTSIKAVVDQSFEIDRTCADFVSCATVIFERDRPC